jgi:hypothetical protein
MTRAPDNRAQASLGSKVLATGGTSAGQNARAVIALFVVLSLLAGLLLAPGLAIGPSLDAAVFTQVAHQLAHGATLYVSAWDHKPPGAYLTYAGAQAALPWLAPWTVTWLVSVLATAGTGVAVERTVAALGARRWVGWIAAAFSVAFMAQYLTALGGGLTEPLATLPATVALALSIRAAGGGLRPLVIGILLGLSLLVSLQLAPAALAIAVFAVVVRDPAGSRSPRRPVRVALLALGAATPWLAVVAWLAAAGALGAAVQALVVYAGAYRSGNAAYGGELSSAPAAWTTLSALMLIAPAILGALDLGRSSGLRRILAWSLLLWIGVSVAFFVYQGRFIAHYAIPLAVPLGVLAGAGMELAASRWAATAPAGRVVLGVSVGAVLVISVMAGVLGGRYDFSANQALDAQVGAVADYLDAHAPADGTLFVWGNVPQLYLASGYTPATRYSFLYPLTTAGYVTTDLVQAVVDEMQANPPQYVVDAGSSQPGDAGFLPLLVARPVADEGRDVDLLDPLRQLIRDHYRLVDTIDGWPVYSRRTAS